MRKILMILVLFVSLKITGQDRLPFVFTLPENEHLVDYFGVPANYTNIFGRYRWIAGMFDSSFHIPRYNGVPSGLRVGSSNNDGALASDTLNGHVYHYWNLAWHRLALFSEVGSVYTANLPIRITGLVISADTSTAFVPSLTTNGRLLKVADSIRSLSGSADDLIFEKSVIRSPGTDSIRLRGENPNELPVLNNTAYSKINNVQGFNPIAIINEVDPQEGDLLRYDADNEEWDNVSTHSLFGKWEWMVDDPNYPNPGDSIIVDSNLINTYIKVFRDGDFQYQNGLTYYYEHDTLTGQLIFHPPLATNERITIFTYPLGYWYNSTRRTAPNPPLWLDFDYDASHDLEELVTDEWTIKGAASLPYTAVADGPINLPASTDGGYRMQFHTTTGYGANIGMDVTSTNNSYGNFDYWAECGSDGTIFVNENTTGSINTGVQAADGDYVAIFRVGSTVTCQKSSNGVTWTLVHTYTATTTGILYPKTDCSSMSSRKLYNPQGWNLEL